MSQVHSLVIPSVPLLVDGVFDLVGRNLSRLVMLGSAIREDFDPKQSDVDVAVLTEQPSSEIYTGLKELKFEIKKQLDLDIQFAVRLREEVERWSDFELCWEGKVARGNVLIDTIDPPNYLRLGREQAKAEVITNYIGQANLWLQRSRGYLDDDLRNLSEWEACRATCRALHAVLLRGDIDPSPKSLRWNLGALFGLATSTNPQVESIRQDITGLDHSIATFEKADVFLKGFEGRPSIRRLRSVLPKARRVIMACQKAVDV